MFSPEFFQRKNTSIHVTGKLCTHFIMSLKKCALTICFKGALKNWTRFQQVKLYIFIIYGVFISLFIDVYNIDQRIEADHYCWKISSKYRIRNQPPPPPKKMRSHQCVIQIYRSDQIPRQAKAFVCAEIVLSNYLLVILMAKWITRHTGLCETFFGGEKTDGALYLV